MPAHDCRFRTCLAATRRDTITQIERMAHFMCPQVVVVSTLGDIHSAWQNFDSARYDPSFRIDFNQNDSVFTVLRVIILPDKTSTWRRFLIILGSDSDSRKATKAYARTGDQCRI